MHQLDSHPNRLRYHLDVSIVPYVRQSQRDKWTVRPAVAKYRLCKDMIRREWAPTNQEFPEFGAILVFNIPIPRSYTKKRRLSLANNPHRGLKDNAKQYDLDNCVKTVLDAIYSEPLDDSHIWGISGLYKYWVDGPGYIIIDIPTP